MRGRVQCAKGVGPQAVGVTSAACAGVAPGDTFPVHLRETQMSTVEYAGRADLATRYGTFVMHVFTDAHGAEHAALTVGTIASGAPVLTRLHSECLTGDVFGSHHCDCGEQLDETLRVLQAEGTGVLLYLRQEGRGIGLANKIRAYALQAQGYDTVDANLELGLPEDAREYRGAAEMLTHLGVRSVRLMTNNPAKVAALTDLGITIVRREPLMIAPRPQNLRYMETKRERMGHLYAPNLRTACGANELALPLSADD